MIHFRPSRDHRLLARLNESVQQLHHQMYPEVFKPYDKVGIEAWMKQIFEREQAEAFVAWQEDQAVGYLVYRILEKPENAFKYADRILYIDQIYVAPGARKSGLG
ncbi:MAG: GNAT family N-acetyltransferase, partial [Bacteroidota bacterium]